MDSVQRRRKIAELEESIRRSEDLLNNRCLEGPAVEYFKVLLRETQEELIEMLLLGGDDGN